jgi:hypothetical protein
MDNVQNCDSYINTLSSQTYRSHLHRIWLKPQVTIDSYISQQFHRITAFTLGPNFTAWKAGLQNNI